MSGTGGSFCEMFELTREVGVEDQQPLALRRFDFRHDWIIHH
jgi:hypothetical protein